MPVAGALEPALLDACFTVEALGPVSQQQIVPSEAITIFPK